MDNTGKPKLRRAPVMRSASPEDFIHGAMTPDRATAECLGVRPQQIKELEKSGLRLAGKNVLLRLTAMEAAQLEEARQRRHLSQHGAIKEALQRWLNQEFA